MSILSYNELVQLLDNGVVQGGLLENVNAASIDVRLGDEFLWEACDDAWPQDVDIAERRGPKLESWGGSKMVLVPGQFLLAHTMEILNLPNDLAAEFRLKSSGARSGLQHALAIWADPGFHGAMTLELTNSLRFHEIVLTPGCPIGQLIFHRVEPVPEHASYRARGRYNGDLGVSGIKP